MARIQTGEWTSYSYDALHFIRENRLFIEIGMPFDEMYEVSYLDFDDGETQALDIGEKVPARHFPMSKWYIYRDPEWPPAAVGTDCLIYRRRMPRTVYNWLRSFCGPNFARYIKRALGLDLNCPHAIAADLAEEQNLWLSRRYLIYASLIENPDEHHLKNRDKLSSKFIRQELRRPRRRSNGKYNWWPNEANTVR